MGTLLSAQWLQKEAPPGSRHTLLEEDGVCEWFPDPLICPENRLSLASAPWVSSGQVGGCETWPPTCKLTHNSLREDKGGSTDLSRKQIKPGPCTLGI